MVYFGHMWPWFPLFDYVNLGWVLNPLIFKGKLSIKKKEKSDLLYMLILLVLHASTFQAVAQYHNITIVSWQIQHFSGPILF
jgi:hypothetical protein